MELISDLEIDLGQFCLASDICADSNALCLQNQCSCGDGYFPKSSACSECKNLVDHCLANLLFYFILLHK